MKSKIALTILGLVIFGAFLGIGKAAISTSIVVKDNNDNVINGGTVHANTAAYVHGSYEDTAGTLPASATMEVRYDDGSGFKTEATLYSGIVNDGQTIIKTYTMTKMGTYEFVWTCVKVTGEATTHCNQQRALAKAVVNLSVPEPATVAGLAMALSALGLIAIKRKKR